MAYQDPMLSERFPHSRRTGIEACQKEIGVAGEDRHTRNASQTLAQPFALLDDRAKFRLRASPSAAAPLPRPPGNKRSGYTVTEPC